MSDDNVFGQTLSTWLHEEAEHRVPDHLGEVLVATTATRQRAWWSSPERWLPMDTTTRLGGRAAAPRALLLLGLLALLLAAIVGGALLTGTSQPTAPTLGTVTNGRMFVADGSTLKSFAADGTDPRVVANLEGVASDLTFSPDGTRLAYIVDVPGGRIDVREIASGRTSRITVPGMTAFGGPLGWSPDGRRILFASTDGSDEFIYIAPTDGASPATLIDTSAVTPGGRWTAGWSPQGDQIAFVAGDPASNAGTLYVARPDGTGLRAASQTPIVVDSASWSPDRMVHRILYTRTGNGVEFVDLPAGKVTFVADRWWPTWSPNGDRVSYWGTTVRTTADSLAGGGSPIPVIMPWTDDRSCQDHQELKDKSFCGPAIFSPDGMRLYAPDITGTSILSVKADGNGDPIVFPLTSNLSDTFEPMAWQPLFR